MSARTGERFGGALWASTRRVPAPAPAPTAPSSVPPVSRRVSNLVVQLAVDGAEVVELSPGDFFDFIQEVTSLRTYVQSDVIEHDRSPTDYRRDEVRFYGPRGVVRVRCRMPEAA